MSATWHIQKNNQTIGPLSAQQLRELALAGKLQPADLVRKGDAGQFTAASGIKNLFADDTNNTRHVSQPPRLPLSEMSGLDDSTHQIHNRLITPRLLIAGGVVTGIVVLIALIQPAVHMARDAARKTQTERGIEENQDRSARTANAPTTIDRHSAPPSDSSASTRSTKAETFMEQLAVLRGLSKDSPLPPRQFDKHGGYFHDPRYYYKLNIEVGYDEWLQAFGEPFDVRKSTYGEFHLWQQNFRGQVAHVSGWLKTPLHDQQIKKLHDNITRSRTRQRPLIEYEDTKWKVIVNAVSVD